MKIELESTDRIVTVNGIPCRVWEGKTESGIPIAALVARVAVHDNQDCSQFDAELRECRAPTFGVDAFPMRLVL